jgi:hypothetical protein
MLPDAFGKPFPLPAGGKVWLAMELAMRHGVFLIVQGKPCIAPPRMTTQP